MPPSLRRALPVLLSLVALLCSDARAAYAQVPNPEAFFGFPIGADRSLASADAIEKYFDLVASRSDRVKILDIGPTTEGHRTIAAIVSAAENIRNLDRIRDINHRLEDPRSLPADEARRLAVDQPAVLAIGGSIHASEVGGTLAINQLLYTLATADDPETTGELRQLVIVLIPSLNPDGLRLVTDWYDKLKGTPYEGGPMPWLYHKYVGHDLNRDGFMMNMAESRNLSRFFYTQWHPQVFLTIHQMGTNGPRFFAPPNYDPIDPNYDPIIWREAGLLGSAMTMQMEREHLRGVLSNGMYDYYWPGYEDSVPLGHNTVCMLTEVASAKIASPIVVRSDELRGGVKGLPEYKRQINFPDPWPGGQWRLRDIVDYDLTAVRGLLRAAASYRRELLLSFYDMGARAVETGKAGGPFAFLIPAEQRDTVAWRKLEELLLQGGVEIERAIEPFRADGEPYPAGTDIILLAQPYRAYAKTLLERQDYPARRLSAGGPPERPYDVTAWTLPAQMGVDVKTIDRSFQPPVTSRLATATIAPSRLWGDRKPDYYVVDATGNGGALAVNRAVAAGLPVSWLTQAREIDGFRFAPGSLVIETAKTASAAPVLEKIATELGLRVDGLRGKIPAGTRPIGRGRIALYKPWTASIDEGWTRWLLEQYQFRFTTLSDAEARAGNLRSRFDAIIIPSINSEALKSGYSSDMVPSEYAGGLGAAGVAALDAFVRAGGTLICLDQSTALAIDLFKLPVRDVARGSDDKFFCPGSILRIDLDTAQPLAYGMPEHSAAFFSFSSAFDTTGSDAAASIETTASYARKDLLMSGWLEGEQTIAGRAAMVQASVGPGRVILIGFRAQHRGQSLATFRLLFNALLTSS